MTRSSVVLALSLAVLGGLAGAAWGRQVKYAGVHPISAPSGGFCYIEAPHVHVYAPKHADVLYRDHDGYAHFVGDPVAYGYDGPKHAYYGHHPVFVDVLLLEDEVDGDEIEYCYLDGPHYHHYAPPPDAKFTMKGGVYWFVGSYGPDYERDKKKYARVNGVYEPIAYVRPVVLVAPPPEYHGPVVRAEVEVAPVAEVRVAPPPPPPPVAAGVGVSAGVEIHVPRPTVEVQVGVPGVVVVEDHHHRPVKVKAHKHKKHKKWKGRGHWNH